MSDPQAQREWQEARNILAIRLDNLGDVLITSPAIHAIRQSRPDASITLLASPVGAQAGRLNPDLDDVIVYQAAWTDPWHTLPQDPDREQRAIESLRSREFDAAIIFSSFRQSPLPAAYLCYLAGVPLRLAASIDGPGSLLTTRHRHPERMMHEVERGLDLVSAVGFSTDRTDLVLAVPAETRASLQVMLHELRAGSDHGAPLVVVHPGCSMPARTYSWERYVAVCDLLADQLGATVVVTGAESERELVSRIRERARTDPIGLAGELSFSELCALIEASDLVITNNTGPMHMAAALKTPVVALFALTNPPEQWGPWRVAHRQLFHEVSCRLCYSRICPYEHECLAVTPEEVVDAAEDLLSEVADAAEDLRSEVAVAPIGAAS